MLPAIAAATVATTHNNPKTENGIMAFTVTSLPSLAVRHVAS